MNTYNYNFFDNNNIGFISDINKFLPKSEKNWIHSNECNSCNIAFGSVYNRQHHCRSCGKSFCWDCCHNTINIPANIVELPIEEETYKKNINKLSKYFYNTTTPAENSKKIVCNNCHSKLLALNKIKTYIYILEFCDFQTLFKLMTVSKNFYYASIYWLFKFKKIQYSENLNTWELNMLTSNSKFFNGHSLWIKQSIKTYLKNNISFDTIYNNLTNNKNIKCSSLFCSLKCKQKLNIYDLIEIFEQIVYYENTFKNFWDNSSLKSNIKLLIQKITDPNTLTIKLCLPIITRIITKLCSSATNVEKIDLEFIFALYDFLLIDQNKICKILTEITALKTNNKNIIYTLEQYAEKQKINVSDNMIKEKKIRDFTVNIYYNNNLNYVNAMLPIPYFFDYDMEIIEIKEIEKCSVGIIISAKIKYLINSKEKEKKILIKRVSCFDEYYMNKIMACVHNKLYIYNIYASKYILPNMPICEMIILSDNFTATELYPESFSVEKLKEKKVKITDFIYRSNKDKTIEKMINTFSLSLSFFCATSYFFNFDNLIFINTKGQVYTANYNSCSNKTNTYIQVPKLMSDIFGSDTNSHYIEFAKKTIELLNIILLHKDLIRSFLRIVDINNNKFNFNEKSAKEIKIIE
jgi:hypothetical protein